MNELQNRLEAWFQPMGFVLHLSSNSPAIMAAAETSFGRFGSADGVKPPDFTFRLMAHAVDDGPPGQPVFRMKGALLYQTTGRDSTLVADLKSGSAFGYFSASTLANPAFFRWHFLELALFMMLESRGLMGVHGAALAREGQAVLLRAQSGGGKTTLAYAAAASGKFQALAEDVVWLDRQRHLWWGMPWSFHLLPDAKKLFPELAACEPVLQTNGEMKLEVNLETIRPGSTTVSAQPKAIVLVERLAGGQSRLEPLPAEAARELWAAGSTGLEMKLPHHAHHLETLLRHKTYRLYFGDDIQAGVDLLEAVFNK
ncbi:MAG TPA: hypothetical protein VEC96_11120 [Anaerolineae bacterium]|nr:hypothetical protein [Anaerolineae bacterium]